MPRGTSARTADSPQCFRQPAGNNQTNQPVSQQVKSSVRLVRRPEKKKEANEDGLGLDTYSSMARAKQTYALGRIVVVTQAFHLPRSLYLAKSNGLVCEGVVADQRRYRRGAYYQVREAAARVRAFLDVTRGRRVPLTP